MSTARIDGVTYEWRGGPSRVLQPGHGPVCACGTSLSVQHMHDIVLATDDRQHLESLVGRTVEVAMPVISGEFEFEPVVAPMRIAAVTPTPLPGTGLAAAKVATKVEVWTA